MIKITAIFTNQFMVRFANAIKNYRTVTKNACEKSTILKIR